MTERKLRFSERRQVAEQGGLGDLEHDHVPTPLVNAIWFLVSERANAGYSPGRAWFASARSTAILYFGWSSADEVNNRLSTSGALSVDQYLDLLEILAESAELTFRYQSIRSTSHSAKGFTDFEEHVNELFERHRFGFRIEAGEARRIGSPALAEQVVGPALLASTRPGWEEVERSYREAIGHQRGGPDERDDALTAANAAVEAALKAAGYSGANLGPLAKSFKKTAPHSELSDVPEALDTLLSRAGAVRHTHGDAHGKVAGSPAVPQALADLAIHWAGSFIVYLASTTPQALD